MEPSSANLEPWHLDARERMDVATHLTSPWLMQNDYRPTKARESGSHVLAEPSFEAYPTQRRAHLARIRMGSK